MPHLTKLHTVRSLFASLLAVCLFIAPSLASDIAPIGPASIHGRTALDLAEQLERYHIKAGELDDETSSVIFDRYLETLDASRAFFTASDVASFERFRFKLDDFIEDEDTSPAFEMFNRLSERRLERYEWLIDRIENHWQDLDFTLEEDLLINRSEETLGGVLGCAR